jgi:hypothetical protein
MTGRPGAPPRNDEEARPKPGPENATATAEQQVAGLDVTVPPAAALPYSPDYAEAASWWDEDKIHPCWIYCSSSAE